MPVRVKHHEKQGLIERASNDVICNSKWVRNSQKRHELQQEQFYNISTIPSLISLTNGLFEQHKISSK